MPEKENFKLALSDEMDYDKRHGKTKIFPNTEQVPDKAGREEDSSLGSWHSTNELYLHWNYYNIFKIFFKYFIK